jgi:spermidine/putrescine transport system substrate-binding protein
MKKSWKIMAMCLGLALGLTGHAAARDQLNVFIWSEYIDPEIISDFEKKFDCKVIIDLYEDNESMMAKLQSGGDALYDICVPGNYIIPQLVQQNLLAPLRPENIPNMKNLSPSFQNPSYDPGNKHTVAYQWGTVGIYMRKPLDGTIDDTWGLLFDASKQAGPFLLMDSIREMLGCALKYKGFSVNTVNVDELKAVQAVMVDAKNRSLGLEGGVGGKNKVLAKTATAAIVYNGDAIRAIADDPETTYFVPREGGVIWCDNLAIPAKAPHRDLAEKFINFILDPEVGARVSNFNQYATPNEASKPFITPEDLANPAIYPPAEMMSKLEFVNDVGDDAVLFDEIWTQIKSE